MKSIHQSVQKAANEFNTISESMLEKLQEFPDPPRSGASPGYLVSYADRILSCVTVAEVGSTADYLHLPIKHRCAAVAWLLWQYINPVMFTKALILPLTIV